MNTFPSPWGLGIQGVSTPFSKKSRDVAQKKEKAEVLRGLLWGWQPAKLLPCRREAKLSSFPWLASPATACAASRQDARGHEGTEGPLLASRSLPALLSLRPCWKWV